MLTESSIILIQFNTIIINNSYRINTPAIICTIQAQGNKNKQIQYINNKKLYQIFGVMQLNLSGANETLIETTLTQIHSNIKTNPISDYSLLNYLRIVFYVFIVIKLVEIVFMRRRKLKISQRIQRKFLFAHGIQMIKNFSAEEHELMNLTLQNTLKNAVQPLSNGLKKQTTKTRKSVSFSMESNMYYNPPEIKKVLSDSQREPELELEQRKQQEQQTPLIITEQKQAQTLEPKSSD